MDDYQPAEYWDSRLEKDQGLKGTGHISYDETYNEWMYRHKGTVLAGALEPLMPVDRALDIGSGTGWVMDRVRQAGARQVDGCDISPQVVERLRERFPEATVLHHSMGQEPLPIADATYDLVTMLDVSYHITDQDLFRATVVDLARVLRPGGALVITDGLGDTDETPSIHVRFRSRRSWEEAAAAAGLTLDRVVPLYRWLSRERQASRLRRLSDTQRGRVEYLLERVLPRAPHLRCATLRKSA